MLNSLSQTLCKFTAPGVPDIYQGNEIWDFSLVDPDNRRPVDYGGARMLAELEERGRAAMPLSARALLENLEDGRAKLYVTWRALQFRKSARGTLSTKATICQLRGYRRARQPPLRLCAQDGSASAVLVVVPRLYVRLLGERELRRSARRSGSDTRDRAAAALRPARRLHERARWQRAA